MLIVGIQRMPASNREYWNYSSISACFNAMEPDFCPLMLHYIYYFKPLKVNAVNPKAINLFRSFEKLFAWLSILDQLAIPTSCLSLRSRTSSRGHYLQRDSLLSVMNAGSSQLHLISTDSYTTGNNEVNLDISSYIYQQNIMP